MAGPLSLLNNAECDGDNQGPHKTVFHAGPCSPLPRLFSSRLLYFSALELEMPRPQSLLLQQPTGCSVQLASLSTF